jgi:hypothetical protein
VVAEVDLPAPRLSPFVDLLPVPPRHVVKAATRLTVRLQTVNHRFHRDLPPSRVWAYDGHVPGPTIEVDRGIEVELRSDRPGGRRRHPSSNMKTAT